MVCNISVFYLISILSYTVYIGQHKHCSHILSFNTLEVGNQTSSLANSWWHDIWHAEFSRFLSYFLNSLIKMGQVFIRTNLSLKPTQKSPLCITYNTLCQVRTINIMFRHRRLNELVKTRRRYLLFIAFAWWIIWRFEEEKEIKKKHVLTLSTIISLVIWFPIADMSCQNFCLLCGWDELRCYQRLCKYLHDTFKITIACNNTHTDKRIHLRIS